MLKIYPVKSSPFRECRCDVASRSTDEAVRTVERIPQSARPTSYHHCKARCSSRPCPNVDPNVNPSCDFAFRERHDKIACGDFTGDKSKEFTSLSCHGTSIDLDGNAEEGVVTSDTRSPDSGVEDAWMRANTLTNHRKIMDSTWRCQCERHPRKDSIPNLSRSSSDRCRDECHDYHRHDYHCDCSHRHCCYQQRDHLCTNIKGLTRDFLFIILRKISIYEVSIVALHVFLKNFIKYCYFRKEVE